MSCNINAVIKVAESQIGYLEKKSNKDLGSKTSNAGSNNYTKYNRDLKAWTGVGYIDQQWCQAFVDWCFIEAYGLSAAKALLGGFTNYTPTGSNWFKNRGQYTKRGKGAPKAGDVIYFYSSSKGRIGHVGIVTKVTSSKVYTIEGNTSGASSLITNGGGVRAKSYSLSSTYIDGYGRPPYAAVKPSSDVNIPVPTNPTPVLGDRVLKNGDEGSDVKELQNALIKIGFDCGKWGADGEFGDATEIAVKRFQTAKNLDVDGEVGPKTVAAIKAALKELAAPVENPKVVVIHGGDCYIRSGPAKIYDELGVAYENSKMTYAGDTSPDGWLAVVYKEKTGWVSGKYGRLEK